MNKDIADNISKIRSRTAERQLEWRQTRGRVVRDNTAGVEPVQPYSQDWVDMMVINQRKINEQRLQDDIRAGHLNTLIATAEKGSTERLSTILEFNASTISLVEDPVGVGCEIKDSELAFDYAMKILER